MRISDWSSDVCSSDLVDTQTLENSAGDQVERNAVAEITLRSRQVLALDDYGDLPKTGRFVLIEDYDTVGGGVISMEGLPDQRRAVEVKSTNVIDRKSTRLNSSH